MFKRFLINPFSLISLFIIALVYLLVYMIGRTPGNSGPSFFLYLLIFLTGIGYIRKTLLLWFPDLTVTITILALAFGTNLFYLVTLDYQLQPILLFSLYAMVVFLTAAWHEQQKQTHAVTLALGLGTIILFQPTGVLALLIPVLWGVHDKASWKSKIMLIRNNFRQLDVFISCLAVLVLPPVLFWNISPGEIPILSFKLPGVFYSFSIWFWNDLFSFDHGWLIYTPIMIFSFIGFYFFAGKNRPLFWTVFLFCFLDLFLETSWSKLGATPVFGQVAFIPAYALLVIPMGYFIGFIESGKTISGVILSVVLTFFILMNVFQTWQYNNGSILHSGMTKDNYSQVFGRTGFTEIKKLQMAGNEANSSMTLKDENLYIKTILAFHDFENTNVPYHGKLESRYVKSGKWALTMDDNYRYSPGLQIPLSELMKKPWVAIRISAEVFGVTAKALDEGNLIISPVHDGENYRFKRLNFDDLRLEPGIWNSVSLDYMIPADLDPADQLFAFVWYAGTDVIYIDDIKIEGFERKK